MELLGFELNSQLRLMHIYDSFEPFFRVLGAKPHSQEPERKDIQFLPLEMTKIPSTRTSCTKNV